MSWEAEIEELRGRYAGTAELERPYRRHRPVEPVDLKQRLGVF